MSDGRWVVERYGSGEVLGVRFAWPDGRGYSLPNVGTALNGPEGDFAAMVDGLVALIEPPAMTDPGSLQVPEAARPELIALVDAYEKFTGRHASTEAMIDARSDVLVRSGRLVAAVRADRQDDARALLARIRYSGALDFTPWYDEIGAFLERVAAAPSGADQGEVVPPICPACKGPVTFVEDGSIGECATCGLAIDLVAAGCWVPSGADQQEPDAAYWLDTVEHEDGRVEAVYSAAAPSTPGAPEAPDGFAACGARSASDWRCVLAPDHTGTHLARNGGQWPDDHAASPPAVQGAPGDDE